MSKKKKVLRVPRVHTYEHRLSPNQHAMLTAVYEDKAPELAMLHMVTVGSLARRGLVKVQHIAGGKMGLVCTVLGQKSVEIYDNLPVPCRLQAAEVTQHVSLMLGLLRKRTA